MTDAEAREMARELVRGSIVEDAVSQFIAQIIKHTHDERVKPLRRQVANLEAKLAKAVEALEPFAKAAETWEPDDGDSGLGARIEHPHHGLERHAEFTFGDLRRARATIAEIKGESHE